MSRQRGRVPEAARMLTQRAQVPAPIAFLPVPVLPKRIAAAYLGISTKTLEVYVADGIVPYVQYVEGGDLFFRVASLDRFIAEKEHANPYRQEETENDDPSPRVRRGDAVAANH